MPAVDQGWQKPEAPKPPKPKPAPKKTTGKKG